MRKQASSVKMPTEHGFGVGWIAGTLLDGRPAYSDGHFMIVGEPPVGDPKADAESALRRVIERDLSRAWVRPEVRVKRQHAICPSSSGPVALVEFSDGTFVQAVYLAAIVKAYPRAMFFHLPGIENAVLAFQDGDFVGSIMPFSYMRPR